ARAGDRPLPQRPSRLGVRAESAALRWPGHAAAASARPGRAGADPLRARAGPSRRADRYPCGGVELRPSRTVSRLRDGRTPGRRALRAPVGHDGTGEDAEVLTALAGRHACRGVPADLLADLRRCRRAVALAAYVL